MAEADPHIENKSANPLLQQLHAKGAKLRSDLLDEFASLEMQINDKLTAIGAKLPPGSCLAQRLDELEAQAKKQGPPFQHPARIAELTARTRELAKLRNSIVHSVMVPQTGSEDAQHWIFNNIAIERPAFGELDYRLNAQSFLAFIRATKELAKQFRDQQLKSPKQPAAPKPKAPAPTSPA